MSENTQEVGPHQAATSSLPLFQHKKGDLQHGNESIIFCCYCYVLRQVPDQEDSTSVCPFRQRFHHTTVIYWAKILCLFSGKLHSVLNNDQSNCPFWNKPYYSIFFQKTEKALVRKVFVRNRIHLIIAEEKGCFQLEVVTSKRLIIAFSG